MSDLVQHVKWMTGLHRAQLWSTPLCPLTSIDLISRAPADDRAEILAMCERALIAIECGDAPESNRAWLADWAAAANAMERAA